MSSTATISTAQRERDGITVSVRVPWDAPVSTRCLTSTWLANTPAPSAQLPPSSIPTCTILQSFLKLIKWMLEEHHWPLATATAARSRVKAIQRAHLTCGLPPESKIEPHICASTLHAQQLCQLIPCTKSSACLFPGGSEHATRQTGRLTAGGRAVTPGRWQGEPAGHTRQPIAA